MPEAKEKVADEKKESEGKDEKTEESTSKENIFVQFHQKTDEEIIKAGEAAAEKQKVEAEKEAADDKAAKEAVKAIVDKKDGDKDEKLFAGRFKTQEEMEKAFLDQEKQLKDSSEKVNNVERQFNSMAPVLEFLKNQNQEKIDEQKNQQNKDKEEETFTSFLDDPDKTMEQKFNLLMERREKELQEKKDKDDKESAELVSMIEAAKNDPTMPKFKEQEEELAALFGSFHKYGFDVRNLKDKDGNWLKDKDGNEINPIKFLYLFHQGTLAPKEDEKFKQEKEEAERIEKEAQAKAQAEVNSGGGGPDNRSEDDKQGDAIVDAMNKNKGSIFTGG